LPLLPSNFRMTQRLDEYLCAGRKVFGACVDAPAEGAYRMALRVVVDDYRAARGGFHLLAASVFLPPLLGMAWGFPVCPGTCTWHLDLALFSPAGDQVWKRTLDPGKGWANCSSALDMARNIGRRFEEVVGELSQTAAGFDEAVARAREAESRRLAAAPARAPGRAAIIAVFTLEDRGAGLGTDVQERLSEYLASAIAASGHYQVIPRAQLKERLGLQKTETYKACYDQNCQIELGKELAAEKTLSTQVIKLGANCMVTAVIFDLRTAASEGGASQEGGCGEDELVRSMKDVVAKLTRAK
ncbi:MAG TPA: hypothetical protein P5076_06740, partial [Myxococcota bacterium]|nr:hypothetical protein [Myxococcota bacterium]